eukprot:Nk52_evm45s2152 gene=Nk52_evmTU45s2152
MPPPPPPGTNVLGLYTYIRGNPSLDELCSRIYRFNVTHGTQQIPEQLQEKVKVWFRQHPEEDPQKAVKRALEQTVLRIINKWTLEQTVYNELRGKRPINSAAPTRRVSNNNIKNSSSGESKNNVHPDCDFCRPHLFTAVEPWGRIERSTLVSASNVAKCSGAHGMFVFKEHDPISYVRDTPLLICDIVQASREWFNGAHRHYGSACYPMLTWNCLGRAGASQHHGHCQLFLAEDVPFGQHLVYADAALRYQQEHQSDYFSDVTKLHSAVGLSVDVGESVVLGTLTSKAGKEVVVMANLDLLGEGNSASDSAWNDFAKAIYLCLNTFLGRLGVTAFNVGVYFPQIGVSKEQEEIGFPKTFPVYARIVDRGDPQCKTTDMCGTEIFAQHCSPDNPVDIINSIRLNLSNVEKIMKELAEQEA